MKLYLAGLYTSYFDKGGRVYARLTEAERRHRDNVRYFLESYHYIHRDSYVRRIKKDGIRVFLDSGAFSSYTKGVKVDIYRYCDYILENQDMIEYASVLDAIGDVDQTWRNQVTMESQGVRPLPCFHYGEPEEALEHYVANYDHITLGGMVPISTPQLKLWLDRIWGEYLTNPDGTPKIKVHGFGLTSLTLMLRYPWYSVDSSSWVQIAANGSILIPGMGTLAVSANSPAAKEANRHLDTLPELQREAVLDRIRQVGFEPDRLRTEYVSRWCFNCWAFTQLNYELEHKDLRFLPEQPTLF